MSKRNLAIESLEKRTVLSGATLTSYSILDFEVDKVPDADWLLESPRDTASAYVQAKGDSGANVFSIAPGAGRNGSQALLVESLDAGMGLPGFWVKQGIQNGGWVGQSNSDRGYFLPRGMQANRLEFWVRFEDGFRSEYAADPNISRTMDVGTYHYNPGKNSSRVVESDNWHFYHKLVLRHDQAGDDWIHVILNESPQDQRTGSGGVTLNPTSPAGNYWELLTRFYVDLSPYFSDPEIGYPAKMWIDDIQLNYVEEPELVEVTFGDSVDGQIVIAKPEVVRDLDVSVTNLSSSTTTGYLKKHAHWRLFSEVFDTQTGEAVDYLTLEPQETRDLTFRINPNSMALGTSHRVGLVFVPNGAPTPRAISTNDANVELDNIYPYSGPADGNLFGGFQNVRIQAELENAPPIVQGGSNFESTINSSFQGVLRASDSDEDSLTYSLLKHSDTGTILLDPQTGVFNFIPQTDFEGIFRFRYLVNDGSVDSKPAASWIAVNKEEPDSTPPKVLAFQDAAVAYQNVTPNQISGNVLTNDIGPGISVVTRVNGKISNVGRNLRGEYGTLTLTANGVYTYSIDNNNPTVNDLHKNDVIFESFSYEMSNSDVKRTSTLRISIQQKGDHTTPIATHDNVSILAHAVPMMIQGNVLENDVASNDQALEVVSLNQQTNRLENITLGKFGALRLSSDGEYIFYPDPECIAVTTTPGNLSDAFEYSINNGHSTDTGLLTISIIHSKPLIANDDLAQMKIAQTNENGRSTVEGNVLDNDEYTNKPNVEIVSKSGTPAADSIETEFGVITLGEDGNFVFETDRSNPRVATLAEGETIEDVITYVISDGQTTDQGTLTINLSIAPREKLSLNEDQYLIVLDDSFSTSTRNLLQNDPAMATESLVVSAVNGRKHRVGRWTTGNFGRVKIERDGTARYEIDRDNPIIAGAEGSPDMLAERFSYTATNGDVSSTTSIRYIIVTALDSKPASLQLARIHTLSIPADRGIATGNLIVGDNGLDQESLEVVSVFSTYQMFSGQPRPGAGRMWFSSDGSFKYRLDRSDPVFNELSAEEYSSHLYLYTVSNGTIFDNGYLTLQIHGNPIAPTVLDTNVDFLIDNLNDGSITGNLLVEVTTFNGNDASLVKVNAIVVGDSAVILGKYGTARFSPTGSFIYELDQANRIAIDPARTHDLHESFDLTISDGMLQSHASLNVNVKPLSHHSPNAVDDNVNLLLNEQSIVLGNLLKNDTDLNGHPLHISSANDEPIETNTQIPGRYGMLTLSSYGMFAYELDESQATINLAEQNGPVDDIFTYSTSDGTSVKSAQLTITILNEVQSLNPGDSNGDGVFDSSDLVSVFQAGEYQDDLEGNSSFAEGDWNGDGDFDSFDFVFAFANGKFVDGTTALDAHSIDHFFLHEKRSR